MDDRPTQARMDEQNGAGSPREHSTGPRARARESTGFSLTTGDPLFDPNAPLTVNGYRFAPSASMLQATILLAQAAMLFREFESHHKGLAAAADCLGDAADSGDRAHRAAGIADAVDKLLLGASRPDLTEWSTVPVLGRVGEGDRPSRVTGRNTTSTTRWVSCPICNEPDMPMAAEADDIAEGNLDRGYITCMNLGCPSNNLTRDLRAGPDPSHDGGELPRFARGPSSPDVPDGWTTDVPGRTVTFYDKDCRDRLRTDHEWTLRDVGAYLSSGKFNAMIEHPEAKRRWAERMGDLEQLLDECRAPVVLVNTLAAGVIVGIYPLAPRASRGGIALRCKESREDGRLPQVAALS